MSLFRRRLKVAALVSLVAFVFAACGKVNYKLPDEFLTDGELLAASMKAAAAKAGENRNLVADNGPFLLESLVEDEGEYEYLYNGFDDALAAELASRGLEVAAESGTENAVIKYRLIECRIVNEKGQRGRVKRVGRTIVHVRIYGAEGGDLFWAGEYQGEFENEVPKSVVSRLKDERIEEIGPQLPETGQNPFVEPLLVTGITGALIYLLAVSASAD